MKESDADAPVFTLPDGRGVWIIPLIGGRARINRGALGSFTYDDGW